MIKVVKNKALFKRFQGKFKWRQDKCCYYTCCALIVQDKNKHNLPKYSMIIQVTSLVI